MSDKGTQGVNWGELFLATVNLLKEVKAKEKADWDALSPEEQARRRDAAAKQAAENAARAKRKARRELETKIRKAAAPYVAHDSFTALQFACLLHGLAPENYTEWVTYFEVDQLNAIKATAAVLDRCAGVTLHPLHAGVARTEWCFARDALLAIALHKKLAHANILAHVMGYKAPAPMVVEVLAVPALEHVASPTMSIARSESPPAKLPGWQQNAVEFMRLVEVALEARAEARKVDIGVMHAEFLDRCRYPALYTEWILRQKDGVAPVGEGRFRAVLGGQFAWLKFGDGRRASASQYLTELLESDPAAA